MAALLIQCNPTWQHRNKFCFNGAGNDYLKMVLQSGASVYVHIKHQIGELMQTQVLLGQWAWQWHDCWCQMGWFEHFWKWNWSPRICHRFRTISLHCSLLHSQPNPLGFLIFFPLSWPSSLAVNVKGALLCCCSVLSPPIIIHIFNKWCAAWLRFGSSYVLFLLLYLSLCNYSITTDEKW